MPVRVSQAVIAAISAANLPHTMASQVVIASIVQASPKLRATQLTLDAMLAVRAVTRASYLAINVLVWTHEVDMPPIYPTLPGLTYSVLKRPFFFTGIATASTGREVLVSYADNPLWEFDLTYNYLPDQQTASSATNSDLKQLMGFYLSQSGAYGGFLFTDPDDNAVSAQYVGTTDGLTTTWVLGRTYGGSDGTGTEPIGYLNLGVGFSLYSGGVLVDPATYDVLTTLPVNQQIRFHSAPATGAVLTATFGFYYYCRFKEDHLEFEKFMDKLWSAATITLRSRRG